MDIVVIMWQVRNSQFVSLGLEEKILETQKKFKQVLSLAKSNESCYVVVFPDYLFWNDEQPYDHLSFMNYQSMVEGFGMSIPANMLCVAGSMEWVESNQEHVSALVVGGNGFSFRYDKKNPTDYERKRGFVPGTTKNTFEWQTLKFGMEICQDHEERTLMATGQKVDIHILLSFGQLGRDHNLAIGLGGGIFIQCELETPQYWEKEGKGCFIPTSEVRTTRYQFHPALKTHFPQTQQIKAEANGEFMCYLIEGGGPVPLSSRVKSWQKEPVLDLVSTQTVQTMPTIQIQSTSTSSPPIWQPDESRTHCNNCPAEFGFFTRKHHCRQCGLIFCNDCSKGRKTLSNPVIRPGESAETGMVRVCDQCA